MAPAQTRTCEHKGACLTHNSAGCGIQDLKEDLEEVSEDYGYLKASASGGDDGADVLVALYRQESGGEVMSNARAVVPGEQFYVLVPNATYTLVAFSDLNGDVSYQAGEPAARIEKPVINWFRDMEGQQRVDYDTLEVQAVELSSATVLSEGLDLSLSAIRENSKAADNFLKVITWDHEAFSPENMTLGMWRPGAFQEQVGCGLYVLEEFDPAKKSIVLVHGINDTPRWVLYDKVRLGAKIPDGVELIHQERAYTSPIWYTP